jgi:hypothetical protein
MGSGDRPGAAEPKKGYLMTRAWIVRIRSGSGTRFP